SPSFSSDHEGSITICIVQALRAARNAGIHVDKKVIDRAVSYVRRSQKDNGSFRYRLNDDQSSFALTAAALATLNATGEYDSKAIDLGLEYMMKKDPVLNFVSREMYPQYARFYAAQAYYQYSDLTIWKRWYPRLVEECREQQYPNGCFDNPQYGSVYSTAMITLTLQVPFGFLPVFQR
ncbi:MAG: prenyltransferase, partial [Planctomycetota bacterium]